MSNYGLSLHILIILTVAQKLRAQPSPFGFKNQFIGTKSNITEEDDAQTSLCTNFWCINDASILFSKSSQYKDVDPCVDFKNFTVNQLDEVDSSDDRYIHKGFQNSATAKYSQQLRKVLEDKSDNGNRIIKVLKNTYKKCRDSTHTFRNLDAHRDIIQHLSSLGGSPWLNAHILFNPNRFDVQKDFKADFVALNITNEDTLWDEKQFDFKKVFEIEPWYALNVFLNLEVKRCNSDVLCLKSPKFGTSDIEYNPKYVGFFNDIYKDIIMTLEDSHLLSPTVKKYLEDEIITPAITRRIEFVIARDKVISNGKDESDYVKISELNEITQKLGIDWLKIINDELLEESHVDENAKIYIENGGSKVIKKLAELLIEYDKKSLADALALSFIYHHRVTLIRHYYGRLDQIVTGTKHGPQRWERCIVEYLGKLMEPALLAAYEQQWMSFDKNLADFDGNINDDRTKVLESAEIFAQEAVDAYENVFIKGTNLQAKIVLDVLDKLKNIKIMTSLSEKNFPLSRLDEFYKELELVGNENFLASVIQMANFNRKINNEKKTSWRKVIEELASDNGKNWMSYRVEDVNVLFIPARFVTYPIFHPLRPRFFNSAAFTQDIIKAIESGVVGYIKDAHKDVAQKEFTTGIPNVQVKQLVYDNYKNWLTTHHERKIGGNHLTNLQLFWFADAVQSYRKFHPTVHENYAAQFRLQQNYLHVNTKWYKGFQEAFNCTMTDEEWRTYNDFEKKFHTLTNKF